MKSEEISEWLKKSKGSISDWIKNNSLYSITLVILLILIIIFIILINISYNISRAAVIGKRYQEECGNQYMEAETERYQIYKLYKDGNYSGVLNNIKQVIFTLVLLSIVITGGIICGSTYKDSKRENGNKLPQKYKWINFGLWAAGIFIIITLYTALGINKDYTDSEYGSSIGLGTEKSNERTRKIAYMYLQVFVIFILTMASSWYGIKKNDILNSTFKEYNPWIFKYAGLSAILAILLGLYTRMNDNLHESIINNYTNKINVFKDFITGLLPDKAAKKYLQNNLFRLNPGTTESVDSIDDSYKLVEHRSGKENIYANQPTVSKYLSSPVFDALFNNTAPQQTLKNAIINNNNGLTNSINITKILSYINADNYKFTQLTDDTISYNLSQTILNSFNNNYSNNSTLSDNNMLAYIKESELKTIIEKIRIPSSVFPSNIRDIPSAFTSTDAGQGYYRMDLSNFQDAFNKDTDVNVYKRINIINPSGTNDNQVSLLELYTIFTKMGTTTKYIRYKNYIIPQMKAGILYTIIKNNDTLTVSPNNTVDNLRTNMGALRNISSIITSTDQFTSLIATMLIISILVFSGYVYNKVYNRLPRETTMSLIIAIFIAVFVITIYAWFSGNLLL